MKNRLMGKPNPGLLISLLGLTFLMIFLLGSPVQADPPPPTPMWHRLEPLFPPPQEPPLAIASVRGTLKTLRAVADAEVRQGSPNVTYGITGTMSAGYDNYTSEHRLIQRALLRFEVPSYLPPGTTILQATLRLYMYGYCDVDASIFRASRITQDWSEMTVTWNNQPSLGEEYGTAVIPIGETTFGWYTFDVTNLVRAWVNSSYPDYGLAITGPESFPDSCAFREFLTKGGGGFTAAPDLVVDYTLPTTTWSVSQNSLSAAHPCSATVPLQGVEINSTGATLITWTASIAEGNDWLSLSKTTGQVSRIFPDQIGLFITQTAPCTQTAITHIQLSAPSLGSSQTITVTIQPGATLTRSTYLPLVNRNYNASTALNTKRIALIISIADYAYLDPPSQFSVVRSGIWGYDLLETRGDGFAMRDRVRGDYGTTVVLMENWATKANIAYALQWIGERAGPDTEVLLYFSGHGGQMSDVPPLDETGDNKDELLGVYDTNDKPQWVNYILDDDLKSWLANLKTEHLAVILDSCRSAGMEVSNPYRAVLAASQEAQNSQETSEFEHGVFTYYMLRAMLDPACDANGDGWVSVQEIYSCARTLVANYAQNHPPPEPPFGQDLFLDLTRDFKVARLP